MAKIKIKKKILKKKITKPASEAHKVKVEKAEAPKKKKRGNPNLAGRKTEFNAEILHKIAREVYIDGLVRGGTARDRLPNKDMTAAKIDKYCDFTKPHVRATLRECIKLGLIDPASVQ